MTDEEDKKALDSVKGPCGICGGKYSEHGPGLNQHAWVPEGSTEMLTHDQAKKKAQGHPSTIAVQVPTNGRGPLQRLIEVLSNKGLLDNDELMYITGITGEVRGSGSSSGAADGG